MNADPKRDSVVASQEILENCRWTTAGFLARLVTMDETWKHLCDPQTKEQSKEWRHSGSPHPKKFRTQSQPPRFSGTKLNTARRLPQKGCNNDSKLIHISLGQSEAVTDLKRRWKLSKRVSILQDSAYSHTPVHYTSEVG